MQELGQSLAHTTAQLARAQGGDPQEMEKAAAERSRAIGLVRAWLAGERAAGRPVDGEFVAQLANELENGRRLLLRFALAREAMRSERMALDRELQVLHGIRGLFGPAEGQLSCRG